MNKTTLQTLIKEQLKKALTEEYQDQYKLSGRLVTNIKDRTQNDILSDIRSITGVTVVSTDEIQNYNEQSYENFNTILNLKIDGYPFIKTGGFSKEKVGNIVDQIRKIPNVLSFRYNPKGIESI